MADIRHYINGQDFGVPRNYESLEITIDWVENRESATINISSLEFVLEANQYLQERVMNGLNGGVGVFEGEPYTIEVGQEFNPEFTLECYLDFTDSLSYIGGEEIVCSLKRAQTVDWITDKADGFSMSYLASIGKITPGDYVSVPYIINYVPDGLQIVVISMSIYMMTKELIENAQKIAETAADATDSATPVIGVSVGLGAGAVTAWDLGNFILVAIKTLARIAYIIAMTIAIINLIEELLEQLLPKLRNHLGMSFRKMMERSCEHLGMRFESSIEELNYVYIPEKSEEGGSRGETGHPTTTGPLNTFGDIIRTLKRMFNADYTISNGVFRFDRRDKFYVESSFVLPAFFNDQERLLNRFSLNTDEMISNYSIYYQFDTQDQNTLDVPTGRTFQAITSARTTINEDLVTIKNIADISLPFSLGIDKQELTDVETILKSLAGVIDDITGVFGRGTNYESDIKNRIGSMLLSSHFTTIGKVVAMNGSNLRRNQREEVNALNLWEKYHFINSFAEYNGEHNQYFIFENQPVPMTIQDFESIMETNMHHDSYGNEYEIDRARYNPYTTTAFIDYRIKRKYTDNLNVEIV